ncbi:hypothetical protein D3C79_706130 [compost metagenome]
MRDEHRLVTDGGCYLQLPCGENQGLVTGREKRQFVLVQPLFGVGQPRLAGAQDRHCDLNAICGGQWQAHGYADFQAVADLLQRIEPGRGERQGHLPCQGRLVTSQRQLGEHHQFGAQVCGLLYAVQVAVEIDL